jgi:GNAT superfamily N-acetyltransferase
MASYVCFERSEIPEAIRTQLISGLKAEWNWLFEGDPSFWDTLARFHHPVSFVALEQDVLVSYAEVTHRSLDYADGYYHVYGLGAVFTRPGFRTMGYGTQVVKAATRYILDREADLGMLFCDEPLQTFYERAGWLSVPSLQVWCGPLESPWLNEDEVVMCLFPSKTAQVMQAKFAAHPMYVGVQHW